jgi:hypothetical protein
MAHGICVQVGRHLLGGFDKKRHMPKMFDAPELDAFQRPSCAVEGQPRRVPRRCGDDPAHARVRQP